MYHRIIVLTSLFYSLILLPSSYPTVEAGIKVTITNLRNTKGHVLVSLFKDGTGYPDDHSKAFKKEKLTILDGTVTVVFTGLPAGAYAIAVLHDENDDQKMNKNFIGDPKEGYGFSNNARGTFGPPSYNKASFRYQANTFSSIEIRVRY